MTSIEKEEIRTLPEKYRPIGAWGYFGYTILFSIPIIGVILLIVFALSGSNVNRRSFARSYFCAIFIALVAIVLVVLITFLMAGGLEGLWASIQEFFGNLFNQIQQLFN